MSFDPKKSLVNDNNDYNDSRPPVDAGYVSQKPAEPKVADSEGLNQDRSEELIAFANEYLVFSAVKMPNATPSVNPVMPETKSLYDMALAAFMDDKDGPFRGPKSLGGHEVDFNYTPGAASGNGWLMDGQHVSPQEIFQSIVLPAMQMHVANANVPTVNGEPVDLLDKEGAVIVAASPVTTPGGEAPQNPQAQQPEQAAQGPLPAQEGPSEAGAGNVTMTREKFNELLQEVARQAAKDAASKQQQGQNPQDGQNPAAAGGGTGTVTGKASGSLADGLGQLAGGVLSATGSAIKGVGDLVGGAGSLAGKMFSQVNVSQRLSDYRLNQALKAEENYGALNEQLWRAGNMPHIRQQIEKEAGEHGIPVADVIAGMREGGNFAELGKAYNRAVAGSEEAQECHKGMNKALDAYLLQQERAQKALHDPEQMQNPRIQETANKLEESRKRMEEKTENTPKLDSEDQSHTEKFREAMRQMMERIKEMITGLFNALRGKSSEVSDASPSP